HASVRFRPRRTPRTDRGDARSDDWARRASAPRVERGMSMNDTFLANGSLSASRVVALALCAERMLLSCPGRAQRDPGPRSDTTSRSHVLRFDLFLRWGRGSLR